MSDELEKQLETPMALKFSIEDENPDTSYKKWEYRPVILNLPDKRSWVHMGSSYYRASYALVEGVVNGNLFEDIEGPAGIFLFRHFLELSLKEIILWGRSLKTQDENAIWEEIEAEWGHKLGKLWEVVLKDARPKINQSRWDSLDIPFVERRIKELADADPAGTAFRYEGEGAEKCNFDFRQLLKDMAHIRMVLEHIATDLRYMRLRNDDWEEMQAECADIFVP